MGNLTGMTGIIISAMPVGEFDKRIVLLTKERGKISAFAKGARRMNSPLMGVTQPFAFGTFHIYEGRTSHNIQQAAILNYFVKVTSDLESVCYACYFAEIAEYFGKENLDASQSINLLYMALKALENNSIQNELVRYIYELKTFVINGEYPQVFTCGSCGNENNLKTFSIKEFSLFCQNCGGLSKDSIQLSESTIYTLQYIVTSKMDKLFNFNVSGEVLLDLKMVMGRICAKIIDKPMKSIDMLLL